MAHVPPFAERGVYVGFRGRGLEAVRCRTAKTDHDVYEALIVNWSGDAGKGGDMIMPFPGLKDWRSLSFFDESLFNAIQDYGKVSQGYMDPLIMRELRLQTVIDHGDEFEVSGAENSLEIEQRDMRETFLEVLALFSRVYGNRIGDDDLRFVTRQVLMRLMQDDPTSVYKLSQHLAATMARLSGLSGGVLARRIEYYSEFAAPICSLVSGDNSRDVGYLSRQLGDLEKLGTELVEHSGTKRSELSLFVHKIKENADKFVNFSLTKANDIQALILDNQAYIDPDQFESMKEELTANRLYISFALDGWDTYSRRWAKAKLDGDEACSDLIIEIYQSMPQPTKELDGTDKMSYDTRAAGMRTGSVREMHSWDNELRDEELFGRVQEGRIRVGSDPEAEEIRAEERKKARAESKQILENVLELVAEASPDSD